MEVRKGRTYT